MGTSTTFRFSEETLSLLTELSHVLGINKTAVMELLVREKARAMALPIPPRPHSALSLSRSESALSGSEKETLHATN